MLYFIWFNPNKIFTVVNAVAINVMVQCSKTELGHYINANGISPILLSVDWPKHIYPSAFTNVICDTVWDCFYPTLV